MSLLNRLDTARRWLGARKRALTSSNLEFSLQHSAKFAFQELAEFSAGSAEENEFMQGISEIPVRISSRSFRIDDQVLVFSSTTTSAAAQETMAGADVFGIEQLPRDALLANFDIAEVNLDDREIQLKFSGCLNLTKCREATIEEITAAALDVKDVVLKLPDEILVVKTMVTTCSSSSTDPPKTSNDQVKRSRKEVLDLTCGNNDMAGSNPGLTTKSRSPLDVHIEYTNAELNALVDEEERKAREKEKEKGKHVHVATDYDGRRYLAVGDKQYGKALENLRTSCAAIRVVDEERKSTYFLEDGTKLDSERLKKKVSDKSLRYYAKSVHGAMEDTVDSRIWGDTRMLQNSNLNSIPVWSDIKMFHNFMISNYEQTDLSIGNLTLASFSTGKCLSTLAKNKQLSTRDIVEALNNMKKMLVAVGSRAFDGPLTSLIKIIDEELILELFMRPDVIYCAINMGLSEFGSCIREESVRTDNRFQLPHNTAKFLVASISESLKNAQISTYDEAIFQMLTFPSQGRKKSVKTEENNNTGSKTPTNSASSTNSNSNGKNSSSNSGQKQSSGASNPGTNISTPKNSSSSGGGNSAGAANSAATKKKGFCVHHCLATLSVLGSSGFVARNCRWAGGCAHPHPTLTELKNMPAAAILQEFSQSNSVGWTSEQHVKDALEFHGIN